MKLIHQDGSRKGTTVISHAYFNNVNSICKKFVNNQFVKSCLITGRQWDAVMKFVNKGISGTGAVYNVTVASASRHTGSQAVAGANRADLVKIFMT